MLAQDFAHSLPLLSSRTNDFIKEIVCVDGIRSDHDASLVERFPDRC